jgi:hypothetical protein
MSDRPDFPEQVESSKYRTIVRTYDTQVSTVAGVRGVAVALHAGVFPAMGVSSDNGKLWP